MLVYVVYKRISEEVNEIYKASSVHYESERNIYIEWNRYLNVRPHTYKSSLSIF